MATTTIGNGQTSTGADVTSGNTLDIQSGGNANGTTIENGGTEIVETGGTDVGPTIKSGGTETINGTTSNALVSGTQTVNAGGVDSTLTVNNGGIVTILKGGVANNSIVNAGGTLAINGNGQANGVTLQGGTLDLQTPKADMGATGSLNFASGYNSTLSIDVPQPSVPAFSETISNFAAGDVIDEKGLTFAGATFSTSTTGAITTVTETGGNGSGSQSFSFSNAASTPFALVNDGNGGTDLVVCFASGTRIRTVSPDGTARETAVEALMVGDLVVTSSGERRPIRWLGHRTIECARHPRPTEVMPIRISAHAFGEGRPMRDLFVSPGHSIAVNIVGEVLIPTSALINGTTIVQERTERVTYWHVELEGGHEIILAENMPTESYLEMGNRGFFAEAGAIALHASPDAAAADRGATHADFCRPFHQDGPVVKFVRERLAARSLILGWALDHVPLANLHLLVDGRRVEARTSGRSARFLVPAGSKDVWLMSDTSIPAEVGSGADLRALGVCVGSLVVDDGFGAPRTMAADDPLLSVGFHDIEEGPQRWTCGRARLPLDLWDGCRGSFFLRVDLTRPALPRWVAPCAARRGEGSVRLAG